MAKKLTGALLDFIGQSPSAFHVIDNFKTLLNKEGYLELREAEKWQLKPGGKYFVTRNGSSMIAFRLPRKCTGGFMMAAAHSDSPTFKIKENPDRQRGQGGYSGRQDRQEEEQDEAQEKAFAVDPARGHHLDISL